MPPAATVDDYIAAQPAEAQPRLRELRAVIRAALPEVSESIGYGMPTYRLAGGVVAQFGAAKHHCALYGHVSAELAEQLRNYATAKGTIRFPLDRPIPEDLVRRLVLARATERSPQALARERTSGGLSDDQSCARS